VPPGQYPGMRFPSHESLFVSMQDPEPPDTRKCLVQQHQEQRNEIKRVRNKSKLKSLKLSRTVSRARLLEGGRNKQGNAKNEKSDDAGHHEEAAVKTEAPCEKVLQAEN